MYREERAVSDSDRAQANRVVSGFYNRLSVQLVVAHCSVCDYNHHKKLFSTQFLFDFDSLLDERSKGRRAAHLDGLHCLPVALQQGPKALEVRVGILRIQKRKNFFVLGLLAPKSECRDDLVVVESTNDRLDDLEHVHVRVIETQVVEAAGVRLPSGHRV